VTFADLTGFTRLGEAVLPEDLERVASQLAELAHYVTGPPVRFVKSIGDAVNAGLSRACATVVCRA